MGAPFPNPVVAGGGALVLPSIHSPGFVQSPLTGWSIDQNGNAFFATITVGGGQFVQVYYQSTAPTGTIATGSLWFNTANGYQLSRWNGSSWVAITWNAADVIGAGTISAALLVAGIVVAGIVDATTITGAQIIADGGTGQVLVYSGTPGTGNLILAISGAAGTDSHSNTYAEGLQIGTAGGPQVIVSPDLGLTLSDEDAATVYHGTFQAGATVTTTDSSETEPGILASLLMNPGAAQFMATYLSGPIGGQDSGAILLRSMADDSSISGRIDLGYTGKSSVSTAFFIAMLSLIWDSSAIVVNQGFAIKAANPTLTSSAATPETVHTASLLNSWTSAGTIRYRLTAQGDLHLSSTGTITAGTNTDNTTIAALGSGYAAAANRPFFVFGTVIKAGATWNSFYVDTSGNLKCQGIGTSSKIAPFEVTVSLV